MLPLNTGHFGFLAQMHLTKLTLSGFKSFADETTLQFGPGITAVVGPNGSGKSNIVDAVLWSLGERSHKALRGHAATDVIFNGSGGRKPTNLAEVSLFFDNESGTLPVKFKEVQVTRRLFRDGDGEYQIGGTRCRLRDVLDLFLDTGVGPDAYCVISQGEIDAILSARPEDRRGLVEGAAGVQKYHARRTETRRKLDRVVADLLRVSDITLELDSQLGPLEAQAELAREHGNYVDRLKFLQRALLARDYDTRAKRMGTLLEGQSRGIAAVTKARTEIENLERLEAITETRQRELEKQVENTGGELTQTIGQLKATEGQIAVAQERRRALTEQQEFQAREIGVLRARVSAAQENLAKGKLELQEAQRASGELSSSAADAEAKLGAANAKLSEATRDLQNLQAQIIEVMRAGQQRREAMAGGRAEAAGLEGRLADLERLRQEQETEVRNLEETSGKTREDLEKIKAAVLDAEQAAQTYRQAWHTAQAAQKAAAEQQNTCREQRARSQSRLNALRELEENLEGLQGGTRSVMQAVQRGQLEDVFVTVADAIRAPRELELAVEVALGGALHNLICALDGQAKGAIGWLKRNQAGRATFLPLSNLRPSRVSERTVGLLKEKGVLGLASELVTCSREHEAAVDYLLGRVLVVQDLDVAIALGRRCDNGVRLVTLEGELVLPAGAITGGQGKQKSSGLLARKRELDELDEVLANVEKQLQASEVAAKSAVKAVEKGQEEWRLAGERTSELRNQVARQEREVEHLEREMRRLKAHTEAVLGQMKTASASLDQKQSQGQVFDKEACEVEAKASLLQSAVAGAQAVVAQRTSEREAVATEVADVRAGYSATQERLAAMKRFNLELERTIQESGTQIRQKEIQLQRAAGEGEQILGSQGQLVAALAELQARHETLALQVQTYRRERTQAWERAQETAATLKSLRITLREAEAELHRVEVRIAGTQAEMAEMERRLLEEFDLTVEGAQAHREDIEHKQAAVEEMDTLAAKIGQLGTVNVGAVAQYDQVKERLDFLNHQRADLDGGKAELDAIIAEIDGRMRQQFLETFKRIQVEFEVMFIKTFGGGKTQLTLTNPEDLLETGIDLRVQMPGKASQDISLLSGGERALTALAFMLALLRVRPSPFVVLDEVDAPLDQSNVSRFTDLLREFTGTTQFIVITHNNGTMQAADVLYGVTQQEPGISTLMSVRLAEEEEMHPQPVPRTA